MQHSSALKGFLNAKCPHCRVGDIYTNSPLHPTKFGKMHKHCQNCGFRYEIEPGFFFGAMYVSYLISMIVMIGCGISISFLFETPSLTFYIVSVVVVSILILPFSFRISRLAWLYLFVGYEPDTEKSE